MGRDGEHRGLLSRGLFADLPDPVEADRAEHNPYDRIHRTSDTAKTQSKAQHHLIYDARLQKKKKKRAISTNALVKSRYKTMHVTLYLCYGNITVDEHRIGALSVFSFTLVFLNLKIKFLVSRYPNKLVLTKHDLQKYFSLKIINY